jgi:hypothetical protein
MADNNGSGPLDIPSVRRRLARRARDERERGMVALIKEECGHWAEPRFNHVVLGFARACLVTQDLQTDIYENGTFSSETGDVRGAVDTLLKGLGVVLKYANQLGITPAAQARLGLASITARSVNLKDYRDNDETDGGKDTTSGK